MYSIGQEVVCINNIGASELTMGAVYTIIEIWDYPKNNDPWGFKLAEIEPPVPGWWSYRSRRFRPRVKATDISVFTRLLQPIKTLVEA